MECLHCQRVRGLKMQKELFSQSLVSWTVILWVIILSKCHFSNQDAKFIRPERTPCLLIRDQSCLFRAHMCSVFWTSLYELVPTSPCHFLSGYECAYLIGMHRGRQNLSGREKKRGGCNASYSIRKHQVSISFFSHFTHKLLNEIIHSFTINHVATTCLFLC